VVAKKAAKMQTVAIVAAGATALVQAEAEAPTLSS
jgi:hypothetical protein